MKILGDGNPIKNAISPNGAILKEDLENYLVQLGFAFSISKRIIIPASGAVIGTNVLKIVVDLTACTCEKLIFIPIFFKAFGAGPVFIDVYQDPTVTPATGTVIPSGNRNFILAATQTPETVWTLSPTVTNNGTKLPFEFSIQSDGAAAVTTTGGDSKEDLIFVPDRKKYLFILENQENTATTAALISSTWAELP